MVPIPPAELSRFFYLVHSLADGFQFCFHEGMGIIKAAIIETRANLLGKEIQQKFGFELLDILIEFIFEVQFDFFY